VGDWTWENSGKLDERKKRDWRGRRADNPDRASFGSRSASNYSCTNSFSFFSCFSIALIRARISRFVVIPLSRTDTRFGR